MGSGPDNQDKNLLAIYSEIFPKKSATVIPTAYDQAIIWPTMI
jgi:hypothetical protein